MTDTQPKVGLRLQDVLDMERPEALEYVCQGLLGLTLDEAKLEAQATLTPYRANGENKKTLIVSSASSASASQETETAILQTRGHIIDIPGAIEARDTFGAKPNDISLIHTQAGLSMTKGKDIQIINLADELVAGNLKGSELYYKSDALILLMLTNPGSPVITKLINELQKDPIIYPYNLDEETQIALITLAKKAGKEKINVNANSPEVAVELTRKGYKYPTVKDALTLNQVADPYIMQTNEWALSQAAKEIHYHPDYLPGYVLERSENAEQMQIQLEQATKLLTDRYGLETAWIKPDRGTDGGSQGSIKANDADQLKKWSEDMWTKGGNWVIEAQTNYFEINLPYDGQNRTLTTTPSVHIIKGEPRYTVSLQLKDDEAWGGNLICSQTTWEQLMDKVQADSSQICRLKKLYGSLPVAMHNYVAAINKSKKYRDGQVRGGADLAVCTLGGKFGDQILVAVQDYNARANGCETAYALYDQAQEIYSGKGEAVTRNITPKVSYEQFSIALTQAIEVINSSYQKNIKPDTVKLIAVSAGWGQIGLIDTDALEIMQNILLLESQLRKMDIIQ